MSKASPNYFKAQFIGWSLYILIATIFLIMDGHELTIDIIGGVYLVFALGIITTHFYRIAIIKIGWLEKDIFGLVPRVAVACMVLAFGFHGLYIGIGDLVFDWKLVYHWTDPNIITWGMLFFMWNLIYFSYIFFQRFRVEAIKNLQLEAAKNEYELRRLKDQMNPHFIFNAMNTIRALIDEDPKKAKNAVTQLSNVLRSSLQTGKQDLISVEKELQIVKDYLEIEKARYEERLQVEYLLDANTKRLQIPPLMLQTIVENCIKHGIAKIPEGGKIKISTEVNEHSGDIIIVNAGRFDPDAKTDSSLGLENTRNRLSLSFGKDAWLTIGNLDNHHVKTVVHLPIKIQKP